MKINSSDIKKILIIKLAAMGDILFASAIASNLKKSFPNASIDWLADSWTKEVVDNIPSVGKAIYYDRPWLAQSKIKGYLEIPKLVKKLRDKKYDLAIIANRSSLASKLAKMAKIPLKVGFGKSKNLDVNVIYDSSKPEVDRNLDLLRAIGVEIVSKKMVFNVNKHIEEQVKKRFLSGKDRVVCLSAGGGQNPGLKMLLKRWPIEYFCELAAMLIKKGFGVVLVGGKEDKLLSDEISKKTKAINLAGKTNLAESAAIIKNSCLFIGADSAPLYIAAAVGTATLGLYGPTDPRILSPIGPRNAYLFKQSHCSPCYTPQSIVQGRYNECQYNQQCLKDLSVQEVFAKAMELLGG
ncbi:MAG: lipopolysaccharide heptosyltransferase II [Actinobacteria bacterium]|nr:MAG: lipopolysaccharide heptosyltransferase II [Actinomycetota bacterium]